MKLKTDENVPRRVVDLLRRRGHDVDTVPEERMGGMPDPDVTQVARTAGRMLVTLDRGVPAFAGLAGGHPGVIVIKLIDQSAPIAESAVRELLDRYDLDELVGCIVIVAPGRIRIRRP